MRTSDTLKRLGPVLAEHPLGLHLLRVLAQREQMADEPETAEWATAAAVYWLSYNWHGGQRCPLYAAGCVTEYRPSPLHHGIEEAEDWLALEAYQACEAILAKPG